MNLRSDRYQSRKLCVSSVTEHQSCKLDCSTARCASAQLTLACVAATDVGCYPCRYISQPLWTTTARADSNLPPDGFIVFVDVVNGNTIIPEAALASVQQGYSAVYFFNSTQRYQLGECAHYSGCIRAQPCLLPLLLQYTIMALPLA